MTMPASPETYHELVVEVGRAHLENLSTSIEGDGVKEGVVGWSHDIKYPHEPGQALEHATTYRTTPYPDINKAILLHPNPPGFLYVMVNALTEAMVDHHNNSVPGGNAIMRPHEEDLQVQLDTTWASFADTGPFVDGDESTLFETPPYNSFRLTLARRAGKLALDFARTSHHARLRLQ